MPGGVNRRDVGPAAGPGAAPAPGEEGHLAGQGGDGQGWLARVVVMVCGGRRWPPLRTRLGGEVAAVARVARLR